MTWHLTSSLLVFSLLLAISQAQTTHSRVEDKASRNLLLVVNQGDQSLSLVDPDAGVAIGKVKTNEVRAHEVTASPDGRLAYLPIYGNSGVGKPGTDGRTVEIVDLDKQNIVGNIDLGPVRPYWVKFGPDGMLYVSAELDHATGRHPSRRRKDSIPQPGAQRVRLFDGASNAGGFAGVAARATAIRHFAFWLRGNTTACVALDRR